MTVPLLLWLRTGFTALLTVVVALAWLTFAPLQAGGQIAYVIVSGNSMEPGFHYGDLAIVREAAEYEAGDVVTYRHPTIGLIIHRIVARDGNRFVLQGDNNAWLDSYHPLQHEIVGRLWLHVPSGGKFMRVLRVPHNMAIFAAVIGVVLMISFSGRTIRIPRGAQAARPARPVSAFSVLGESGQGIMTLLFTLLLGSGVLALIAFERPLWRNVREDLIYEQSGAFDYTAAVPAGVYDSDQVATGEPVFRKLADAALVHFDYQFMAGRPATITGTHRLVAIVGNADGWKRTVELTPRTVFAGPAFEVEGRLNFDEIQSLIDTAETETGMLNEQYFLTVQPEVEAMGTLAGEDVRETFAPRLEFRFDDLQLQLARDGGTEESPLQETKKGMIERQQPAPNTISLLMLDLSVARARWLGLSGLLAAIAGLAVCGMLALREHRSPEPERIAARYRTQLVAIAQGDGVPTEWTVVEVARFESLLKIAGAKTRMILDEDLGTMHRYYVHDDGMTYRYSTVAPAGRLAAEPGEVA